MPKISSFIIIKNEAEYVGASIMSVLDHIDEMIFADGNSTDGTIEIIEHIQQKYDKDKKIKLFKDKDCKDLKQDYVDLFNWTLKQCSGDYVWFLHPDMVCINPQNIRKDIDGKYVRYSVGMKSIAGENRELEIVSGRDEFWATIYKNAYGLHYYGFYGAAEEDLYFKDFTGDEHTFYKYKSYLPYQIKKTEIGLYHYCDTKPYARRLSRMISCLLNQYPSMSRENAEELAKNHPRVTLQDGTYYGSKFDFELLKTNHPEVFYKYEAEFERFRK